MERVPRLGGTGSYASMSISLTLNAEAYCRLSLFTAGTMIGFDASGHIAEETKNAR